MALHVAVYVPQAGEKRRRLHRRHHFWVAFALEPPVAGTYQPDFHRLRALCLDPLPRAPRVRVSRPIALTRSLAPP